MKFLPAALVGIAGMAVIGFAVYWTKSGACLWALLLLPYVVSWMRPGSMVYKTKCPQCHCQFLAEKVDDDDEDEGEERQGSEVGKPVS